MACFATSCLCPFKPHCSFKLVAKLQWRFLGSHWFWLLTSCRLTTRILSRIILQLLNPSSGSVRTVMCSDKGISWQSFICKEKGQQTGFFCFLSFCVKFFFLRGIWNQHGRLILYMKENFKTSKTEGQVLLHAVKNTTTAIPERPRLHLSNYNIDHKGS